jgi:uncharacterized membrane protein YqgA involved in biofilm formation
MLLESMTAIPLFGSIANATFIICGAFLGLALRKKLPQRILELPVQGMAIFVISLGLSMSITTKQPLIVIASIAAGSLIGELIDIEGKLGKGCAYLENRFGESAKGFSSGFFTASLIYCTGSMAVLGAFEEGLGGYPSLLLAKGLIDGLTSIALAASLGFGVIFSAIPVFLYQGTLTLAAVWIQPFMSESAIIEMSATGGLMLVAIGINLLGFMKIRAINMLPGLVIAVILAHFFI